MIDPRLPPLRVAVDVGGTFTDVVVHDVTEGTLRFDKVPTIPSDLSGSVLGAFAKVGAAPSKTGYFAHGTTLGLNALLTRTGANTAIVTTQGFRDVYLLGRTDRVATYDFKYRKPASLVKRSQIFEVPERINFKGETLKSFDTDAARAVATAIQAEGIESVAVCFLHSYVNPAHEISMLRVLAEVAPDAVVTLSHTLTREYREYERTSTTVFDAYIRPVLRAYISRLEVSLAAEGFEGRFLMIRSGGGALPAARAMDAPVNLILSGPAGGVIGAAWFGAAIEEPNLVTIDMGGTSLDASLVIGGQPIVHQDAAFEGLPIMVPSLYIHTIGAGGGSLAWVDEAHHLQVGPMSAGAVPGPAAYGQGGTEPTFTDAALVCGYLGADVALAGTLVLDEELAREAVASLVDGLALPLDQVADGVLRIAVTKIVGAIRSITIEVGHDPRDFAVLAFGGAGGLIACDVARQLSIGKVIVPPGPGSFSALGMLMADVQFDFSQTFVADLEAAEAADLEQRFGTLEREADHALAMDGFPKDHRRLIRFADLRYQGQEHTISMQVVARVGAGDVGQLIESFAEVHRVRYGHALSDPVEVVALRTRATGVVDRPAVPEVETRSDGQLRPVGRRLVYRGHGARLTYAVYHRDDCLLGDRIEGPAVIQEHTSTTILHLGDAALVGRLGELQITVGSGADEI